MCVYYTTYLSNTLANFYHFSFLFSFLFFFAAKFCRGALGKRKQNKIQAQSRIQLLS